MAVNWLAYAVWGHGIDWIGVLAVATVMLGLGLMITLDEI